MSRGAKSKGAQTSDIVRKSSRADSALSSGSASDTFLAEETAAEQPFRVQSVVVECRAIGKDSM